MTVVTVIRSINLFLTKGTADKIYNIHLNDLGDNQFTVTGHNARRGKPTKEQKKTKTPVTYDKAVKIYEALLKQQTKKGYTDDESGVSFIGTDDEARISGLHCQLLNTVDESTAKSLCKDDKYWSQQKINGERRIIKRNKDAVTGINKRNLTVNVSTAITKGATQSPDNDFIIDAEILKGVIYVFDALRINGVDITSKPFHERVVLANTLVDSLDDPAFKRVRLARNVNEKHELHNALIDLGAEGIVYKDINAPYTGGRPASGGSQFKFKFYEEASVIVASHNSGKRSVGVQVYLEGNLIDAGNITIPENKEFPEIGDVIEVRYLDAGTNYVLFTTTYKEIRTDVHPNECRADKLKLKNVEVAA